MVCLGDSFDDGDCEAALAAAERDRLTALMAGRDWVWVAGNHDPGPVALGGRHLAELALGPLVFRHAPRADAAAGDGRPCFLHDARRLILPAFGAYTGGLCADHPAVAALLGEGPARAILTGRPCLALPLAPPRRP